MFKTLNKLTDTLRELNSNISFDLSIYQDQIEVINSIDLTSYSDTELQKKSQEIKNGIINSDLPDNFLTEAFALVKEATRRVLGIVPYDVQMIAAIAIHQGKIVEMQTGEGKTLTAVFPAYLNGLSGKGVHILTFNDYLAQRDAHWMGPVLEFLGLTTSYINEKMNWEQRKQSYLADITYVTVKEAGFDYLRDFLCTDQEKIVQRPFSFAIIDEADSILIDEGRIPLVIGGNEPEAAPTNYHLSHIVRKLLLQEDFEIEPQLNQIYLTKTGIDKVEKELGCGNLYREKNHLLLNQVNCALEAEFILQKDIDYIVRNGRIEIIDEFTGRVANKRNWPNGLQAAVEAKEGVITNTQGKIISSVTIQNFINIYPKLAGMSGTVASVADELREFYNLNVQVIPTNRLCIRRDHRDLIFTASDLKWQAVVSEVKRVHKKGQPILIGTSSVDQSEKLAELLHSEKIVCKVLNAKNDEAEAEIIAKAGEVGAVTVSTNMAGRGVDIKLGGRLEQDRDTVISLGGLYLLGTNRHETSRIDNQLRGRAGRQGDPGESRFYVCLEDQLLTKSYNPWISSESISY